MNAMDPLIATLDADDTAAALRLLKVLEECGQMDAGEAGEWTRRIVGWARFNAVGPGAEPSG